MAESGPESGAPSPKKCEEFQHTGCLSGKTLDFATRNRKCKLCDIGVNKDDHDCRKNFEGSAKAMEADVGAQLVNESEILKEVGLQPRMIIGDEDSSTIPSVRRETKKHPTSKKVFVYAVQANKSKPAELAATLLVIPNHVFGRHENCGLWCSHVNPQKEEKSTILLKDPELHEALLTLFAKYSKNSNKLAMAASSQGNENVNAMMSHKAPKNRYYSRTESADFRFASTICHKNDGDMHLVTVTNKLHLSPSKHMEKFCERKDKFRYQRAERELRTTERIFSGSNDFVIIYFDIETSGLDKTCEILQIAAKSNDTSFNIYVTATKKINRNASEVTGLTEKRGKLCYNNNPVISSPLSDALVAFNDFLKLFRKLCILVAHNAPFDTRNLIRAIIRNSMISNFRNIFGFTDSLAILRKKFPERKGPGMMNLGKLAEDVLEITGNFHEALFDVEILQKLSEKFISNEQLLLSKKSYLDCVITEVRNENALTLLPVLMTLKSNVSEGMLKKLQIREFHFICYRKRS
ncbi:uncharacterized protein LOC135163954 [Diachasmimorpha longicaudata]|uniref:uncharacterized protein LOC135163954 n=1 Tax=Diachasmimorpha longicaudata TaxID=58733 RepID=UPI0030B89BDD